MDGGGGLLPPTRPVDISFADRRPSPLILYFVCDFWSALLCSPRCFHGRTTARRIGPRLGLKANVKSPLPPQTPPTPAPKSCALHPQATRPFVWPTRTTCQRSGRIPKTWGERPATLRFRPPPLEAQVCCQRCQQADQSYAYSRTAQHTSAPRHHQHQRPMWIVCPVPVEYSVAWAACFFLLMLT
jgi:hypothetical protein